MLGEEKNNYEQYDWIFPIVYPISYNFLITVCSLQMLCSDIRVVNCYFELFLAYETRSVKLKLVNDSRFISMSIYNVVVSILWNVVISGILI